MTTAHAHEPAITIDIEVGDHPNSRTTIALDPETLRVYSFAGVGSGVPEDIYFGNHPTLATVGPDVDSESLAAFLRGQEAQILAVAEALREGYGNDAFDACARVEDAIDIAIDHGSIARAHDAADWLAGDWRTTIDDIVRLGVPAFVDAEIEHARAQGVILRRADLESVVREIDDPEVIASEYGREAFGVDFAEVDEPERFFDWLFQGTRRSGASRHARFAGSGWHRDVVLDAIAERGAEANDENEEDILLEAFESGYRSAAVEADSE